MRAQRDDVQAYAEHLLTHATMRRQAFIAALTNADRKITKPRETISTERKANLDFLETAPRAEVDTLHLPQQLDEAPADWALQKAYATGGTDPAPKQVATAAVPMAKQDYNAAKALALTRFGKRTDMSGRRDEPANSHTI